MKREKDQTKQKFKDLLLKEIVDKGEVKTPSSHSELFDLEYCQDGKSLSCYGGHFQQLYFIVASVIELFESDLDAYYARK